MTREEAEAAETAAILAEKPLYNIAKTAGKPKPSLTKVPVQEPVQEPVKASPAPALPPDIVRWGHRVPTVTGPARMRLSDAEIRAINRESLVAEFQ